jgi:adapter protein MecA 1/2
MDAIHGLFNSLTSMAGEMESTSSGEKTSSDEQETKPLVFRVITFNSLQPAIKASKNIAGFYFSTNTLYKNPSDNKYYLLLTDDNNTSSEFSRACCLMCEYGNLARTSYATPFHFMEHYKVVLEDDAVQTLCAL